MLSPNEEALLYTLSVRLGVEIYMVGVGERAFLPKQYAGPGSVTTAPTGLSEWHWECAERPDETPWWIHTHPEMNAFFSDRDVCGAHVLWDTIRRPIYATVLGLENQREEVLIDQWWIDQHPLYKYMIPSWVYEINDVWRDALERKREERWERRHRR